MMTTSTSAGPTPAATGDTATDQSESIGGDGLSPVVVTLLRGALYREVKPELWQSLVILHARVRDYVSVLGLDLVLDEAEGYAFLRSRPDGEGDSGAGGEGPTVPRLIPRRPLTFPVSLLLALLRKKLAEFDADGADTRLVLSRNEMVEMIRVFLPDSSNEARLIDQVDTHINRVVDLGFLRKLQPRSTSESARRSAGTDASSPADDSPRYEVRRILRAFVDGQWLADFDRRLAEYHRHLSGEPATGAGTNGQATNGTGTHD
jgi:hypothetical protein